MTQFTHEKVLFTHKLWPTPLPTNIVTPNWLYTSLPAQCTYMHTVCFVCCFYLLFQLHIIYYPALGLQWHKNYGYLDWLKPSRWHILLYKNYWHTHHHPTTYKQTGLITIQCTRASAQCKKLLTAVQYVGPSCWQSAAACLRWRGAAAVSDSCWTTEPASTSATSSLCCPTSPGSASTELHRHRPVM